MRILLVAGMSAGGVGRHVHGLAQGLAAAGHQVVVALPSEVAETYRFEQTGAVVRAVEIAERPNPGRDAAVVSTLRAFARGADIVHAHGVRAGALAALATVRRPVPLVVTLHNAAPPGRFNAAAYAVLERVVALRAGAVLGVSSDLVDAIRALGARRVERAVVAGPAPAGAARSAMSVRRELGLPKQRALGVVVARLAPQKGLDTLLDASARLRDLDVLLVVAGDGPLEERLQAHIDEQDLPVRLLGRRGDVADLLAAADVVVSSAVWEGQPVALQEALHAGAPIVATDAGGTAETLLGAVRLVPVADPQALADGIRAVLADPREAQRLRDEARVAAPSLPTASDAVAAALSTYRDVLADAPTSSPGRSGRPGR